MKNKYLVNTMFILIIIPIIAISASCSKVDPEKKYTTVEHKLAIIDFGHNIPASYPEILNYKEWLDVICSVSTENREQVADLIIKTHDLLKQNGLNINIRTILSDIRDLSVEQTSKVTIRVVLDQYSTYLKSGLSNHGAIVAIKKNLSENNSRNYSLKTDKIDGKALSSMLSLYGRKESASGNGRVKTLWSIKGLKSGSVEIIGNNQKDADQIGWQTPEFDTSGNYVKITSSTFTYRFFVKTLAYFVDKPNTLADELLIEADPKINKTASRCIGDLSFETDGIYFFVRHNSRR